MTNAVTTQKPGEVTYREPTMADVGVSANDIELPRIFAMQPQSPQVVDGDAKMGDFVSNMDNKVLGSIDKPMEFIPLSMYKVWHVFDSNGDLKEIEPFNAMNANRPYQDNGLTYSLVMNFYVLLPGEPLPFILGFKKTSLRAGKALATQILINQKMGKPPYGKVIKLTGKKEKNDKGTFIRLGIIASRDIKKSEEKEVLEWVNMLNQKPVREAPPEPNDI
jgi:hypothetical protein